MGKILERIQQFFDQDNWPYSLIDERPIYKTSFEGKNGQFNCYAQERTEQQQFVFYSVFPARVPTAKLGEIAELVTRANYGLIIGNFELDYHDGEVRYKTSVDVEDVELGVPMVMHLVYSNVLTIDRYFPAFMRVLYAAIPPEDAIKEVEDV